MGATKEYYLKLQEEHYNELENEEKMYLNRLGLKVKYLPTDIDKEDSKYKTFKSAIYKAHEEEQKYLYNLRNK